MEILREEQLLDGTSVRLNMTPVDGNMVRAEIARVFGGRTLFAVSLAPGKKDDVMADSHYLDHLFERAKHDNLGELGFDLNQLRRDSISASPTKRRFPAGTKRFMAAIVLAVAAAVCGAIKEPHAESSQSTSHQGNE